MSLPPTRSAAGSRQTSKRRAEPDHPVRAAQAAGPPLVPKSGRLSPLQALSVARERLLWNRRADRWDDAGSAGLTEVVEEVLRECRASASAEAVAVDLGAGSGQIAISLAESCGHVLAVDVSAGLLERLTTNSAARGVGNVQLLMHPIETLDLPPASVDLVVSNYALHHLRDVDKERLLKRCHTWLRPGGRIVISDMMFGRGAERSDRAIIASKAGVLLRRGPGGWWRLLKNAVRFGLRLGEKPLPPGRWESLARGAGFHEVSVRRLRSEAHLLTGTKAPDG
jgi:SAM-dependent methyltransferase